MATKLELQGAFGSLLDTLKARLDLFFPSDIVSRWLAVSGQASGVADTALWGALASDDPRYESQIVALNRVTNGLVAATQHGGVADIFAALDAISTVLNNLGRLLAQHAAPVIT